jgi:hypothetical protein
MKYSIKMLSLLPAIAPFIPREKPKKTKTKKRVRKKKKK